jgi:putative membrane protein
MAWVRTALALISFGFTIAKFFEYLREQRGGHAPVVGSRTVGVLMIAAGLVAMAVADVHHRRAMKDLRKQCPELPVSIAGITSAFIVLLGILALVGVVLRQ